jgi:hypothetical protein
MNMMTGLLLLESVLLVATLVLLIYGVYEGKRRDELLREVGRVTKVLTRHEYFFAIMEAMHSAKQEILGCITGTPPTGDDVKMTSHFAEAIRNMTKKGVKVMYLLPKFPDRIPIAVQYTKAGAEVLFSSCLMVHSIRYTVVDERVVVLGIPESIGEREATKKGYTIPSEGLAMVLKNYFNECEDKTSLKAYLQEVCRQTGATVEHLAREFRLDEKDLKELVE